MDRFKEPSVIPSKGKSGAVISFKENLLIPKNVVFPTIEVVSKLCKSEHVRDYTEENQKLVIKELGYYSDLQSIKSEDAITWSLFGFMAYQESKTRLIFFNELLKKLKLQSDNSCEIKLWQRLPHPDNFCSGGPEMDVILLGEKYLFLVECKWSSAIGKNQGINKNKNQIEIRKTWIENLGCKLYPNHQIIILSVANANETDELFINWDSFCSFNSLPHKEEYSSYLTWRKKYLKIK